jgi:hypothetical protein
MGNFEKNIGKFIMDAEDQIQKIRRESWGLDWGHECDCEFCDRDQEIPPETEVRDAEIKAEIKSLEHLQASLQAHAKMHGVPVFKGKQKRDRIIKSE